MFWQFYILILQIDLFILATMKNEKKIPLRINLGVSKQFRSVMALNITCY